MEFLKIVDTWFLVLSVALLGGFFLWAVQYLFNGIKTSIKELGTTFQQSVEKLEKMISDLYDHRNSHESRIVALETKCSFQHGEFPIDRQGHGRRATDAGI